MIGTRERSFGCCACGRSEPAARLLGEIPASPTVAHLPLTALRAFDLAAQKGSFALAAAALGVTPAAVSQQVKRLEIKIGVDLFIRSNRKVTLTRAGVELHGDIRMVLGMLVAAFEKAKRRAA